MRSDADAKVPLFLAWLVPAAVAAIALSVGLPPSVSAAAYEANVVFGIVAVLVAFLLPARNLGATAVARLLVLLATALPVSHIWITARCDGALLAGIFPQSDAGGYFSNALAILAGRPVWDFATRPISFSAFGPLVLLTGFNLKTLVLTLTLMNAAAIAAATEQVQKLVGGAAAGVFAFGGLCLYRMTAGWLMTEQMGILLGITAAALLLNGCHTGSAVRLSHSLFVLFLALLCRAGAFFALPALAAGITLLFPCGPGWRGWFRAASVAFMALVLALAFDFAVGRVIYEEGKRPPSNFWYTAWGVLNDADWIAADKKFNHEVNLIKDAAIQQAKAEPWRIWRGATRAISAGFHDDFFFTHLKASPATCTVLEVFAIASLLGVVIARIRRLVMLLGLVFLGVLASLPFAPPWDGGIRIHAALLPTLTVIPAIGLAVLVTFARGVLHTRSLPDGLRHAVGIAHRRDATIDSDPSTLKAFVTQMPATVWVLVALCSPLPILFKCIGAAKLWPESIRSRLEPSNAGIIDPGLVVNVRDSSRAYLPDIFAIQLREALKRQPWRDVHYTPVLSSAPSPCALKLVLVPEEWKSYALNKTVTVHRFALCLSPASGSRTTDALMLPKDQHWNSYLLLDSSAADETASAAWQKYAELFRSTDHGTH